MCKPLQQAMIFAAGEGQRMRPLTLHTPKPLIEVGNKPLIEWHLERLAAQGVNRIVINVNYLQEKIMQQLGSGSRWGVEIIYSPEDSLLETGGGLLQALPLLKPEPFWLISADAWCASLPNLPPALPQELAFLYLVPNPKHHPAGDFLFNAQTKQLANLSAPAIETSHSKTSYTYAGISRLHPAALADEFLLAAYGELPQVGTGFKLAPLWRYLVAQGRVQAEIYRQAWVDVGTPERLAAAEIAAAKATAAKQIPIPNKPELKVKN